MENRLGKIPLAALRELLLGAGAGLELDANPLTGDLLVTTNPAIGVPEEWLGFFAYHYSASNLAVSFARPELAVLSAVFPEGYPGEAVERVLRSFVEECRKYGTRLVGGHTARYRGLELPLLSSTMVGRAGRRREKPAGGDRVVIVGEVGAEAAWLAGGDVDPSTLTPLPAALALQEEPSIKLMHDVSEGGVIGALLEVAQRYGVALEVSSRDVKVFEGLPRGVEPLSAPSYGAIIAVTGDAESLLSACEEKGLTCSNAGVVAGPGNPLVVVDGREYAEPPVSPLVYLYGAERRSPEEAAVALAAEELVRISRLLDVIPEVGANIAYAPGPVRSPRDVLALDGRIVKTTEGARLCGKPRYGASRHLAEVLASAREAGMPYSAAVNLKYSEDLLEKLKSIGLPVCDATPYEASCPVSEAIRSGCRAQVYFYAGKPGLEASIVLLARDPLEAIEILRKVVEQKR
ncbi:thiamine-phosphate synthase family protein [Thermofilum pendens]|uniref:thiamine-phosphate synthase family protein n=1 Tax=Thermofilum pendens TaxID=2269 RepID=UPI000B14C21E|nr:thiamine-phosphate synthase family protein [Thermofilum pendens]